MATLAQPVAAEPFEANGWQWFRALLLTELSPYPGRGWTVARMTIAATLVMLCIMVFRLPNAALGAYYTLLFSRDSVKATFTSVLRTIGSVSCSLLYLVVTLRLFAGEPFLHFLWVAGTLFLTFFLISALSEYLAGTAFGFLAVTAIASWDFPANTGVLFANTLWTALAVLLAAGVTLAVEVIARGIHPTDEFHDRLLARLHVVVQALLAMSEGRPLENDVRQKLEQYAMVGTASLRQLLARSLQGSETTAELSAMTAMTGRLIDLAAHVTSAGLTFPENERAGFKAEAHTLQQIADAVAARDMQAIATLNIDDDSSPSDSFLEQVHTTISQFPKLFSGLNPLTEYMPLAIDFNQPKRLFKHDAFISTQHLRFALRGTLAATTCYFLYNAVDWRGLSSSVATCMITALSTVGSSRQKQMLRVAGTMIGGVVIGMSAQIFLLPYMDGIGSFTLLFAAVTGLAAWIGTASPRISYAGVQIEFAFYVTHLRTFGPQTSLTVARDDVLGILLGLMVMWVTFDVVWAKDTAAEVRDEFVANLRRIACSTTLLRLTLAL